MKYIKVYKKFKTFFAQMTTEIPQVKITSFKRLDNFCGQTTLKNLFAYQDSIYVNVLLYTEQESLKIKQLQNWIGKEQKNKINFLKLLQEKSVLFAIRTLLDKRHRTTFFITNKPFTTQIQNFIKTNPSNELNKILEKLNVILLMDQVQNVSPESFHLKSISLITTEVQRVKEVVEAEAQKYEGRIDLNDLSSMNSQAQQDFEAQFMKSCDVINMTSSRKLKEQRTQQIVVNDTPGVGLYNISTEQNFKGSKSGTFSKQTR